MQVYLLPHDTPPLFHVLKPLHYWHAIGTLLARYF